MQIATNALWCCYNSILSKVKSKDFKTVISDDCWVNEVQEEIHKFNRIEVWELSPPPDCAVIIAHKWIFKVKLDVHDVVLNTRQGLLLRDIIKRKALILRNLSHRFFVLKLSQYFSPMLQVRT